MNLRKMGTVARIQKRGKAWYSKRFRLDESDRDKQILIEFEGISSYATVYLNGSVIGRNFCGLQFILSLMRQIWHFTATK